MRKDNNGLGHFTGLSCDRNQRITVEKAAATGSTVNCDWIAVPGESCRVFLQIDSAEVRQENLHPSEAGGRRCGEFVDLYGIR